MEDLVKELTIDMVPDGDNRIIAETIGVENYYKLCSVVGGSTIYLQKPESVLRPVRDAHTKDQRGRKPRQNNHPANPQSIPLPYFMNGSLDFQWCRMPQSKTAAQPEIGKKIPQQHHPHPEAVKKEQPVCHAGWKASNPWNRGCHLRHLVKRRIGGGQVPLNHSF